MSGVCPRCGKHSISKFKCRHCGYHLHITCVVCGKANIPSAHFCGNCGTSFSIAANLKKTTRKFFSSKLFITFYNLASGFAFGSLLAFFAFCTMGFSKETQEQLENSKQLYGNASFQSETCETVNLPVALYEWRSQAGEAGRKASIEDVMKIGSVLIEALDSYSFNCKVAKKKSNENCTSKEDRLLEHTRYLNSLRTSLGGNNTDSVSRSELAVFFYRILSNFIKLSPEMASEPGYSDIPRYHYLTVPIKMLELLEINLARDKAVFGNDDDITIAELGRFAAMFLQKTSALSKSSQ